MNRKNLQRAIFAATLLALAGCATQPPTPASMLSAPDAFFAALKAECNRAFAGHIVADTPTPTGADPFAGKSLVMHVRECTETELRIPFHVGEDRSRTWVLNRTMPGLRLKHDHRHADGSDDKVTQYGGDTQAPGTVKRQAFPVDDYSKAMFLRENLPASVTNTWAVEINPGKTFVYELSRPGGRLFRVEFDLSKPIAIPPPPWGDTR